MDARWQVLADTSPPLRELSLPLLWTVLILAGIALAAGLTIVLLGRWLKNPAGSEARSSGDQLAYFRLLYEQGECSREEYERIRAKLGQRLRKELDLPSQTAPAESPAQAEGPSGPSTNGTTT